jgi:S-(hydroxymethyl)glutathione dehydrogenase/alcohol dehydrogenase
MAASLAGADPVIAMDRSERNLQIARQLGADAAIHTDREDPLERLRQLVSGGLDVAIEASGRPTLMQLALAAVRPQGGKAVVVGNAPADELLHIDPRQFNQGKRLLGTWGGDNDPERDFPRYIQLLLSGKLRAAALLDREYPLSDINAALEQLHQNQVVRPLIRVAEDPTPSGG